jgi:hypothetical protein
MNQPPDTPDFKFKEENFLHLKDDQQLARWQAGRPGNSAKYILAEKEWQRRLLAKQHDLNLEVLEKQKEFNREIAKYSSKMGFAGVIVGALITAIVAIVICLIQQSSSQPASKLPPHPPTSEKILPPHTSKP